MFSAALAADGWVLCKERAERVAAQAPLAVQAALQNAKLAHRGPDAAAEAQLPALLARLSASEDARIGMEAFLTRTTPQFEGR